MSSPPTDPARFEAAVPETFHWSSAAEFLGPLVGRGMRIETKGRFFEGQGLRCWPPLVLPIDKECDSLDRFVATIPSRLGLHLVILMQAGAVSLGLFDDGEALLTKSFKRYVVRGKGRAQPTHLESKGKSRYGSRLRLQNAKRLLEETNQKLSDWVDEFGLPERIFTSAPVRLWPSLFEVGVSPPFQRDDEFVKIPLDLPRPRSDVLLRAYRSLSHGRLEAAE